MWDRRSPTTTKAPVPFVVVGAAVSESVSCGRLSTARVRKEVSTCAAVVEWRPVCGDTETTTSSV